MKQRLIERLNRETGLDVNELNVSRFVTKINVDEALIIHDKEDKVIPISYSKRVQENWSNAKLTEVQGTGHFRILRSLMVLSHVSDFMSN